MKKTFYSEIAYAIGLVSLAIGASCMERADFGMSMVVAPAYLVYLKVSQYLTWYTFGMAEYCFQAVLLVLMCLVIKRFRKSYLFSFVAAFIYGNILDLMMKLVALIPEGGFMQSAGFYIAGLIACAIGVSLLFHTYLAPEVYELFVKEFSSIYKKNISKVKTVYDCTSCLVAVIMSFAFMGFLHFEGVKGGTILCALINGTLIGLFSKFFEKRFEFKDGLNFRKYFM